MKNSNIASTTYWVVTLQNNQGVLEFISKETVEPRAGIEIHTSPDALRALKIPEEDKARKFVELIQGHCIKLGWNKIYIQKVKTTLEIIDTVMLLVN